MGRGRLTIICGHSEKLNGPSGIVREVGSLILAGGGNLAEQVSKIPQLDPVLLGEGLCLGRRTPRDDDPFVVARREAILLKLGDNFGQLELPVDEIADRSALTRCFDADLQFAVCIPAGTRLTARRPRRLVRPDVWSYSL